MALLAALTHTPLRAQQFVDLAGQLGLDTPHVDSPASFTMSGGLAWLDMDADGDDDLLVTSSDGQHRLYQNLRPGFDDVSATSGLDTGLLGNTFGVICGDYDNDGLPDVFLTSNGPNQLFHNDGAGVFSDVTSGFGIAGDAMSSSASWADFDRDGDLELYVGNYIAVANFPYHIGAPNRLFVNLGTAGAPAFDDQASALGVDGATVFGRPVPGFGSGLPGVATAGCTLSVCTLDWDEDGDPDLMIGNDFGLFVSPNRFYRNDTRPGGPLRFSEISEQTGFDVPQYNMGINPADYDHDGDWDIYLSNLGDNALLRNDGGVFHDRTQRAGPVEGTSPESGLLLTSWGTVWGDFDNDGWEDLYVANGYVPAASFIDNEKRSPNGLWRNLGDGSFRWVNPSRSGAADEGLGRGVMAADPDGDGLLDLFLVNNGSAAFGLPGDAPRLFHGNGDGGAANHWAEFRLVGTQSNREGLGARLELTAGGRSWKRQVRADPVYLSSPSRVQHVGLGDAARIDELVVHWPSGVEQVLHDLPVDVRTVIEEPRPDPR